MNDVVKPTPADGQPVPGQVIKPEIVFTQEGIDETSAPIAE